MKNTIVISEIFGPTIQGEGALTGRPTVFVRTGGCDFRCSWCDTLYAVLPEFRPGWSEMTPEAVLAEVTRLSGGQPLLVTLSGGNPAMQPLGPLIEKGHDKGFAFALETQGTLSKDWFRLLDYLVLSPKPPSSGMKFEIELLRKCVHGAGRRTAVNFKIVVFDEADYLFAYELGRMFPEQPFFLQPGNANPRQHFGESSVSAAIDIEGLAKQSEWLLSRALSDGWADVTILPQLHTLLWGNKRGV